jgi:hypothetical protein
MALQRALAEVLPHNLAAYATVASMNAGELNLFADNGAVAAKLRQMTPRMLTSLRQRGYDITGIRLQVQVSKLDNPLPPKQISISVEARNVIDSLTERLDPSPLKSALKRLARQGA